jgi:protein SCO1/2
MITRRAFLTGVTASAGAGAWATSDALGATEPAPRGPRAGYFPNFMLRTHEGKQVRFYDDLIRGKIVVINMMYADCTGICPAMTANLVKVQRALAPRVGRDIFMYSITLQPKDDTPAVLNTYVKHHGVGPGWQFLTGRPAEIEILRRRLGYVDPDPALDRDKANHTGVIRFGNEARDSWGACPALGSVEQIVKAILWMDVDQNGVAA